VCVRELVLIFFLFLWVVRGFIENAFVRWWWIGGELKS
jgi:hypothetical protein